MTWFRRRQELPPASPVGSAAGAHDVDADSPGQLRRRLWEQVQHINRSAGQLPAAAVVTARQITDTIRWVIDSAGDRELDVYAVVLIKGIVDDYLPTTLRAYLNLDPAVTDQPGRTGQTPTAALIQQLDSLAVAAEELRQASGAHDVDALFSQGNFLRTKFTRSDLDL